MFSPNAGERTVVSFHLGDARVWSPAFVVPFHNSHQSDQVQSSKPSKLAAMPPKKGEKKAADKKVEKEGAFPKPVPSMLLSHR